MAVLIFYKKKAGLRPSAAPETSDGDPGWAFFLSTSGAIVAIVNAVVMGISVGRYSHKSLEKRRSVFGICVHGASPVDRAFLFFFLVSYFLFRRSRINVFLATCSSVQSPTGYGHTCWICKQMFYLIG